MVKYPHGHTTFDQSNGRAYFDQSESYELGEKRHCLRQFFCALCTRQLSSQQSNSTRNSTTPISPIAMKRDGNSRANNDENVVVESLSIIEETSVCSCMKSRYKIDIILIY